MSNFDLDLKDPKGHTASVASPSPYESHRNECAAMVSEVAVSRIRTASEGIRAIVSILQQRETDFDGESGGLKLSNITATGLLNAIACCTDFAEMHATGESAGHTLRFDCDTTDHWHVYRAAGAAGNPPKAGG